MVKLNESLTLAGADEDRGGVSFLGTDEDGVGRGGIEGDLCLLRGDGSE